MIECLALVLYFEARGEPLDGQLAVAEVVLNRVESSIYPDTVCEVVQQRRQFVSDGPVTEPDRLEELVGLSESILEGDQELLGLPSTHFHSGSRPFWALQYHYDGRVGGHRFYTSTRVTNNGN
jgi:spore germination cell wall hydrolase CwlJ-like protein